MKTTKYTMALALSLIALLAPRTAHADDIVAANVSNLTFNGNNVCGPSGTSLCSEIFNVSFLWDNTTGQAVAGSLQASAFGPLGAFTFAVPTVGPVATFFGVVLSALGPGLADNLVLGFYNLTTTLQPGSYPIGSVAAPGSLGTGLVCDIHINICTTDFGQATHNASSGTATVTPAPEPASIILLGTGLLGLLAAARRKQLA